jgi:hypothetical protein
MYVPNQHGDRIQSLRSGFSNKRQEWIIFKILIVTIRKTFKMALEGKCNPPI